MGYAYGLFAEVFLGEVARTADQLEADTGIVLGAAIAHELGHLLGVQAHSSGIMSARLGRDQIRAAERGELAFREEDARLVRSASGRPFGPAH